MARRPKAVRRVCVHAGDVRDVRMRMSRAHTHLRIFYWDIGTMRNV